MISGLGFTHLLYSTKF